MKDEIGRAGEVTIMDAKGKVINRVLPEHFYRRQAEEAKAGKIKRRQWTDSTPEEKAERARKANQVRWDRKQAEE